VDPLFICPVCGAEDWEPDRTYPHQRTEPLDGRERVLWEQWLPDRHSAVFTLVVCRRCGLCCYSPRPTPGDVEAKYLASGESGGGSFPQLSPRIQERARRVHRQFSPYVPDGVPILDVGGGHGQLLRPFVAEGHDGHLVDYARDVLPGVMHIGTTLSGVPGSYRAAICSHVLEHVVDPGAMLADIRQRMDPQGVLFVEVPSEVWRGIPIAGDVVTHINFFTPTCLQHLLIRTGWDVLMFTETWVRRERQRVLAAVATPGNLPDVSATKPPATALPETVTRMHPTSFARLARAAARGPRGFLDLVSSYARSLVRSS
jgi:catechol 2,3-dioxygenase-like lactoylglutathione lyase family enzyme